MKSKKSCFVISPIGEENSWQRDHSDLLLHSVIKPIIEGQLGYSVQRADEMPDAGMITDAIISALMQSSLVIADLTDLNPNVMYELGIRHAAKGKTIHVAKSGTKLPFDTAGHRAIFVDLAKWSSTEDARLALKSLAEATEKDDFRVSNPITHAQATFEMKSSGDTMEAIVAGLSERMASVEASIQGRKPSILEQLTSFAPRKLSELQIAALFEVLKSTKGSVKISYDLQAFDGGALAHQIATAFNTAGWKVSRVEGIGGIDNRNRGIVLRGNVRDSMVGTVHRALISAMLDPTIVIDQETDIPWIIIRPSI